MLPLKAGLISIKEALVTCDHHFVGDDHDPRRIQTPCWVSFRSETTPRIVGLYTFLCRRRHNLAHIFHINPSEQFFCWN